MSTHLPTPWLLVLAGPPGTGKTTLTKGVVAATRACYLRVDAIEAPLSKFGELTGPEGYVVMHELAASNLLLGNNVVVDAVNPIPEVRSGWLVTAERCGARLVVVEVFLDDTDEHRRRVETRVADIPGHEVPTWAEVQQWGWVPWDERRDGPRTKIDAADGAAALASVLELLKNPPSSP